MWSYFFLNHFKIIFTLSQHLTLYIAMLFVVIEKKFLASLSATSGPYFNVLISHLYKLLSEKVLTYVIFEEVWASLMSHMSRYLKLFGVRWNMSDFIHFLITSVNGESYIQKIKDQIPLRWHYQWLTIK